MSDYVWTDKSIPEIARAMDDGIISSAELVRSCLSNIRHFDQEGPCLNSMICVNKQAEEISESLDEEFRTKGRRSLLHGIPIILKDNMQAVIEALEKELREKEAKEKPLPPTQEESMATVLEKNNNSSIAEALHIEAVPFENEKEEKNICGLDLREYNTILYRIRQILVDEKVWANSGCTQHDCFFK